MSYYDEVYEIVRRIPHGKVATYGQIAWLTGSPRASRAVGYALHFNPEPGVIPCHRVVNRFGGLAPAFAFGGIDVQKTLLEKEGVKIGDDYLVDLATYQWRPETRIENFRFPPLVCQSVNKERSDDTRNIDFPSREFVSKRNRCHRAAPVVTEKMKRIFLETERLILREEDRADFPLLVPILGDPEVMHAWEHGFSDREIFQWIERRERGYRENGFDYFLAVEKSTGEALGQIGLLKETLGGETLIGLGWILKRSVWGKGYATEGALALAEHAFRKLGIPELVADIRPGNRASRRVAERIGMRETNTVVKIADGKEMPHIVYRLKNPARKT